MTRLISFKEVQSRTGGLSSVTYWRLRKAKQFPEPIAVSANRKVWREEDITAWIAAKTSASSEVAA